MRSAPNSLEHLARGEPAGGPHGDPRRNATLQPRDTDHEELVQVAGKDREEVCSLEDGQVGILSEFEDALVEGEPGDFAIQETVRRQRASLGLDSGGGRLVLLDLGLGNMGLGGIRGHVSIVPQRPRPPNGPEMSVC